MLRRLLPLPLLGLLLAAGTAPAGAHPPAGRRPNLLIVMADDMGFSDLEADRTELHNLAGQHPEKVKELAALYQAWADRCGVLPWARGGPVIPRPTPPDPML